MSADRAGALFAALQRPLPQHALSRVLARIAESRISWLKNFLIRRFVSAYAVDLREAENPDPRSYTSFNEFFTRPLKAGARPVDTGAFVLTSPADGALCQFGAVNGGRLFQAKGHSYTTVALLGSPTLAAQFEGGQFATIYLAPHDYHRVHMPIDGRLVSTHYIPGRLFSVNAKTTAHIPGLFARNERLVCVFDTDAGHIAVILVGAMFVAGIETVWQRYYSPGQPLATNADQCGQLLRKGAELGRFKFGSTVILLGPRQLKWNPALTIGARIVVGQSLGRFDSDLAGSAPDQ